MSALHKSASRIARCGGYGSAFAGVPLPSFSFFEAGQERPKGRHHPCPFHFLEAGFDIAVNEFRQRAIRFDRAPNTTQAPPCARERERLAMNEQTKCENFAVLSAMLKAGLQLKAKLGPVEYAKRFAMEKALQQRRFCDAFTLWRTCSRKVCRRQRHCDGDAGACLQRALDHVPHALQWRARQDILDATPRNIGAPERAVRQCMPRDLFA
jgi:hypothetical protein